MKRKTIALAGVKTAGLAEGQFEGYASVFDHLDSQGDIVRRGAFTKSIGSGQVVPLIWTHQSNDPRAYVGEVKTAEETDEGLRIVGEFDLDSDEGRAAYRQVKARRVTGLSIGYTVKNSTKSAETAGATDLLDLDLQEISLVPRGANDRALIDSVKSAAPTKLVKARAAISEAEADDTENAPADDIDLTVGERLLTTLQAATEAAQEIVQAAEDAGRDLSDDEAVSVAKSLRTVKFAKGEIAVWNRADPEGRKGIQWTQDVGRIGDDRFHAQWPDATAFTPVEIGTKTKTTRQTKAEEATSMDTQYLNIGGHGRKSAAAAIVNKIHGRGTQPWGTGGDEGGTKALTTSGQITTDVPMARVVVPTGRPATSLLDVIPSSLLPQPTYAYLRQNSRNLAAATVAPGAVKPTSAVGVETIQNSVSVVAHLSEPIDKFVMADAPQLQRFVADEMLYGLDLAIQAQALSGNGTPPNQRGILNTSGVQLQAFATDILTTVRKAITAAEALGYAPSVLVISPADWEAVELLATTAQAIAFRGVPIDQAERKIWGLTAVLATGLPAKTALVLDPAAMSIDTVGGVEIEWAKESGDLFSRNQVQVRVETRIGVSIFQPAAITKVTTAAA